MPAFNHRFERPSIAGIPLYAAISGVVTFFCLALFFLFPNDFIQFVCLLFGLIALLATVFFLYIGEDIAFFKTILNAYLESKADYLTREVRAKR